MKAILEFQLPDEAAEHLMAVNAGRYHSALWQARETIRATLKHNEHQSMREWLDWVTELRDVIADGLGDE